MKRRKILFLLFALSGFTGLIYESIWTQYLKLFLGHTAYAQTLVLTIFMGGIALGSWICGRYSMRWKNLLVGYALTEGVIGLFALFFHNAFDQATQFSYASVFSNLGSSLAIASFKWTLSALMILPQTILLGMTFPLMTAGIIRAFPDDSGRSISMLYFTNSFGGGLSVLTSGFILIKLVGLPGTIRVAGLINICLSICVWLLARGISVDALRPEAVPVVARNDAEPMWYRCLLSASLITGTASFIYEIGWVRMLNLVLGSSTHAFELMLSAFIFGLAFGGLWIRYRIQRIADTIRFLAIVQVIMGALALVTLPLYGKTFVFVRWLMNTLPPTDTGYALFNLSSSAIALFIMFPTTFCAGMTLPLITYSLVKRGHGERSIGAVYAANTVGAILGVCFASQVAMPLLGVKGVIISGAGLDIALGLALVWLTAATSRSYRTPAVITFVCIGVVVSIGSFVELDFYKMASGVFRFGSLAQRDSSKLVFYKDGRTATVSSFLQDGALDIRTNGKPDAQIQLDPNKFRTVDEPTMILLAAIPMSLNPHARTVANIGFGSGLTASTLLLNNAIGEVDTIEIEPVMVEAAKNFGSFVELAYTDPRSRIFIDDAKTFFSAHKRKYDIIISEPSNPWVSGVSGLFSEEFYRVIGRHLTENGVFCQWLQLYEIDLNLVVSVLKAVSSSFTDYVIYAANDNDIVIIAKNGSAIANQDFAILKNPKIARSLKRIQVNSGDDLAFRKRGSKQILGDFLKSFPIQANSDYYPILDQNAVRTRFLAADARELLSLACKPLPVLEMMTSSPSPRDHTDISHSPDFIDANAGYAAMALRDYYLSGRFAEKYSILPADIKENAVKVRQLFFSECGASSDDRIGNIYNTIALQMIPFLHPHELDAVWKKLESGACVQSFTPRDQQWITLFKAVGQRNAAAMASTAKALFEKEQDLQAGPMRYLVASGMLGDLVQGKKEASLSLWQKYQSKGGGKGQQSLFLRLLVALSTKR
jgi:predicted membrane-bound spermidine synthase